MAQEKSEDEIRATIVDKANQLGLPIKEENVTLERTDNGSLRIKIHYSVEVKFLGGFYRRFNFNDQTEAPPG